DGPGDGRGTCVDGIAGHGDPIAAGRGHVAHGDHHGLAGPLRQLDLPQDEVGSEGTAAGAVHPQHHGLDGVVVACLADQLRHGIAADGAGRLVAVLDVAFRHDHADAAAEPTRVQAGHVVPEIHGAEAVVGAAHHLLHRLLDLVEVGDLDHEVPVARQAGG